MTTICVLVNCEHASSFINDTCLFLVAGNQLLVKKRTNENATGIGFAENERPRNS